ncbi:hypothetical protein ANO11243_055720 [Dothideomycetidae sp. 11243]|nr:hypothetical protein ANO11243_055720 [fungal sp. No.11243]
MTAWGTQAKDDARDVGAPPYRVPPRRKTTVRWLRHVRSRSSEAEGPVARGCSGARAHRVRSRADNKSRPSSAPIPHFDEFKTGQPFPKEPRRPRKVLRVEQMRPRQSQTATRHVPKQRDWAPRGSHRPGLICGDSTAVVRPWRSTPP